jgi:hypothetical protein
MMRSFFFIFALALAIVGCSNEQTSGELLNSDANGFLCRKCNFKFFTSRSVYADFCPTCKSPEVAEVIGFFCDKDQTVTLSPKAKSAVCTKCGTQVGQVRLPSSAQFVAWGAVKKAESDVKNR